MTNKEDSSFLQEVESRLDSLFGEDPKPAKEKEPVLIQTAEEELTRDIKMDEVRESTTLRMAGNETEVTSEPVEPPPQDKSAFVSEIDKRFSEIFGDDDKSVGAIRGTEKPDEAKIITAEVGQTESKGFDKPVEEISLTPSSVLYSPLKNLKSIVLSLEWEINDRILEQLDDEVNKLYLLYTGDRIIQGLLRILRFVGRYVRVRGARSNQDSIDLLMSVYDQLENVMVAEGMTEAKKHILLIESIKKYRSWVENTDLESPTATQSAEMSADEIKPLDLEPPQIKFPDDQKEDTISFADVQVAEEKPAVEAAVEKSTDAEIISFADVRTVEDKPVAETVVKKPVDDEVISFEDVRIAEEKPAVETAMERPVDEGVISFADVQVNEEKPVEEEPLPHKSDWKDKIELVMREPDLPAPSEPVPMNEIFPSVQNGDVERMIAAIKNLPPDEAFAYALEGLKKTYQAEIDALKEEIRLLKNAG